MRFVHTEKAPEPVGPYSQAVSANGFLYISGQIGMAPGPGSFPARSISIEEEATQALANIGRILEAEGLSVTNIVKVNGYLLTMDDFGEFNIAYKEFFGEHRPARAVVAVAELPAGARVEIEAVAQLK